jgi:hypothetical protein
MKTLDGIAFGSSGIKVIVTKNRKMVSRQQLEFGQCDIIIKLQGHHY